MVGLLKDLPSSGVSAALFLHFYVLMIPRHTTLTVSEPKYAQVETF